MSDRGQKKSRTIAASHARWGVGAMKRSVFCSLIFVFLCFGLSGRAVAGPTRIEVLFMNHGPLQDTLSKIRTVFAGFGDKLAVTWYDFESDEGEKFMAEKGIRQHIPLVIWIDDSPVATLGEKKMPFVGFPTGSGPLFFQGKWTVDDLKAALDQATAKK
jgi:hypothetical protein